MVLRFRKDAVVEFGGLTWEEAWQLAARRFGKLADEDLAALQTVAELVRWNAMAVRLSLRAADHFGWDSTIKQLTAGPPVERDVRIEKNLYTPIYLAYETLTPVLQKALAMMGAMPHFRAYELNALSSLWQVQSGRALTWGEEIAGDSGLLEANGGSTWTMHEQVFLYAKSLFERLPDEVRCRSRGWLERVADMSEVKGLYRVIWNNTERQPLWKILEQERSSSMRNYYEPLLKRVVRTSLFFQEEASEWNIFEANAQRFTSLQYALAYIHRTRGQKDMRRVVVLIWFLGPVLTGIIRPTFDLLSHQIPAVASTLFSVYKMIGLISMAVTILSLGIGLWNQSKNEGVWLKLWAESEQQ